jgi:RNA polymerase sigma-70 factor (ECF subfamily)
LSEQILQAVARGEASAVRECLDRYAGLVWTLARRFSASEMDAEDAAQEIFISLWRSAARFDPARASEATFVAMIARRRLIDRARAKGRQLAPAILDESVPGVSALPAQAMETIEDASRAAQALATLSPEQQRVLQLAVHRGLSHEQIASSTGLPLGTVKTHIRRGLMHVREALETRARASSVRDASLSAERRGT